MAGQKGMKGHKLTGAQIYKVYSTLVELQPDFERGHTSFTEAAEILTKKLGFIVPVSTVKRATEQGIVSWEQGRAPSPVKRVESLEKRVSELEEIVLRLLSEQTTNNGKAAKSLESAESTSPKAWVGK